MLEQCPYQCTHLWQAVFVAAKRQLGEVLSAFEFLDRGSLEVMLRLKPALLPATATLGCSLPTELYSFPPTLPAAGHAGAPTWGTESAPRGSRENRGRGPEDGGSRVKTVKGSRKLITLMLQAPFYLVVETSGSNANHDGTKLEAFLEHVLAEVHWRKPIGGGEEAGALCNRQCRRLLSAITTRHPLLHLPSQATHISARRCLPHFSTKRRASSLMAQLRRTPVRQRPFGGCVRASPRGCDTVEPYTSEQGQACT